jgi:hypothetical protein
MPHDPRPVPDKSKTFVVVHPVWTGNSSYAVMYGQTVVTVHTTPLGPPTFGFTRPPKRESSLATGQIALAAAATAKQLSARTDNRDLANYLDEVSTNIAQRFGGEIVESLERPVEEAFAA